MSNNLTPIELSPLTSVEQQTVAALTLRLNLITRKLNEVISVLKDLDGRVEDLEDLP